jgi:DNA repair exonuclease SbcCD ATPase subunit
VRLLTLSIENFGPFVGKHELELAQLGLVSVVGVNAVDVGFNGNGVGKSSILDALMWGLFGETSARKESAASDAGLKADEVINESVGKDCIVTVTFNGDNEETHRVQRWRKAKIDGKRGNGVSLHRYAGGDADNWFVEADLDAANVQRSIDEKLGFDRDLFSQTVIRGQEDGFTFAQATPKERFGIFTRIEGLEELDAWEAKFRERGRVLANEVTQVAADLHAREGALAVLQEEHARMSRAAEQWEADRAQRLQVMQQTITQQKAAIAALEERLYALPRCDARIIEIDAMLAPLVAPVEPPELAQWEGFRRELQQQIGGVRGNQARVANKLMQAASLQPGSCEACGQSVDAEHVARHRGGFEAEKAQIDAQLVEVQTKEAEAARVIQTTRQALDLQRQAIAAQRSQLERERAHEVSMASTLRAEERTRAHVIDALDRLIRDANDLHGKENPVRSAGPSTKLVELEASIAGLRDASAKKHTEAGLVDWWVRNIPTLKAWIFDSVVAEVTKEANRWLSILTGGLCWVEVTATATTKAGEVRDRISLKCFRWNPDGTIAEREFRQWSGGEKRRISLALDWALAARLAQRAKSRCSFLALDEVDRHLDAAGRAGLLAAFEALRSEKETILLVSHDENFRAKPDVFWQVTKTAAGSHIEVSRAKEDREAA